MYNNDSIASLSTHYLPRNTHSSSSNSNTTSQSASSNNAKVVIINFDDSHKNQYTYAKPILDKYGFKATFFEVCNWVEAGRHDSIDTVISIKHIKIHVIIVLTNNNPFLQNDRTLVPT